MCIWLCVKFPFTPTAPKLQTVELLPECQVACLLPCLADSVFLYPLTILQITQLLRTGVVISTMWWWRLYFIEQLLMLWTVVMNIRSSLGQCDPSAGRCCLARRRYMCVQNGLCSLRIIYALCSCNETNFSTKILYAALWCEWWVLPNSRCLFT